MLFIVVINYNFISKNKQKYLLEHTIVLYTGKFLHCFILTNFVNFAIYCHATLIMFLCGSFTKILFVKLLKSPFL